MNQFMNKDLCSDNILDTFIYSSLNKILNGGDLKEKLILYCLMSNYKNSIDTTNQNRTSNNETKGILIF